MWKTRMPELSPSKAQAKVLAGMMWLVENEEDEVPIRQQFGDDLVDAYCIGYVYGYAYGVATERRKARHDGEGAGSD